MTTPDPLAAHHIGLEVVPGGPYAVLQPPWSWEPFVYGVRLTAGVTHMTPQWRSLLGDTPVHLRGFTEDGRMLWAATASGVRLVELTQGRRPRVATFDLDPPLTWQPQTPAHAVSDRGFVHTDPVKGTDNGGVRVYESSAVHAFWPEVDEHGNVTQGSQEGPFIWVRAWQQHDLDEPPTEAAAHLPLEAARTLRDQLSWLIEQASR